MYAGRIEKTRHEPSEFPPSVGPPRGVLQVAKPGEGAFFHQRLAPPAELQPLVQHFWYVQWDVREAAPVNAETLPHPNCYLVFEHDLERPVELSEVHWKAEVSGVTTRKFSRLMEGYGRVFGLKFRPGGMFPFLRRSVSTLTDRVVPAAEIFGPDILGLAMQLRALETAEAMAAAASSYFAGTVPAPDANAELAATLVDMIFQDSSLLTVEALASRSGLGVRALQRLFKMYVGASPKWVIRRFRLHEVLERFHSGEGFDGAQLALDLGYADQAHLINDFRRLVGVSPGEYLRRAGG
jgi:AraC-like DNA-binding protein